MAISLSPISKIIVELNCPDVDKLIVCTTQHGFQMRQLLIPHSLVFTVRAITCVYSDQLDWVIDFTPHCTLRYSKNHGPVKLYNIQSLSDSQRLCVSLLSKHTKILFWTGPTGYNLVKLEGPKIDFDNTQNPSNRTL